MSASLRDDGLIEKLSVTESMVLREVMDRIDRGALGLALLVDEQERFLHTVTDGDLRRAMLAGCDLESPISSLSFRGLRSLTAPTGTPREEQLDIMLRAGVRHLPLLNEHGAVIDLALSEELLAESSPMQAVIMAGGFGKRLRPLTDDTPKPMLPIGGKPLMERTVERIQKAGIQRIHVTTHYMPEKIKHHFGSGDRFGVEMNYVAEDQPLGTAGALRLMEDVKESLLVINGDILTGVNFRSLHQFHQEHGAALTVALRQYEVKVPYGVVEVQDGVVRALREKPCYHFSVNAGIYLIEPYVREFIPDGEKFDMTDLIEELLCRQITVVGFPVMEYWLDIGQHEDFERAQQDIKESRWAA